VHEELLLLSCLSVRTRVALLTPTLGFLPPTSVSRMALVEAVAVKCLVPSLFRTCPQVLLLAAVLAFLVLERIRSYRRQLKRTRRSARLRRLAKPRIRPQV
jgi:hypothetical protein